MKNNPKRPGVITGICIISLIGALLSIPFLFSDSVKSIGYWYPIYLAFSIAIEVICIIGLWLMKKWGLIVYITFFITDQIIQVIFGSWNLFTVILPIIVITIGLSKYKEMK